ncbi:potassium/proton antiporter [Sesbania bispinosa]|nr:potassium/proton antiporter [Sesbania bispinosa]
MTTTIPASLASRPYHSPSSPPELLVVSVYLSPRVASGVNQWSWRSIHWWRQGMGMVVGIGGGWGEAFPHAYFWFLIRKTNLVEAPKSAMCFGLMSYASLRDQQEREMWDDFVVGKDNFYILETGEAKVERVERDNQ